MNDTVTPIAINESVTVMTQLHDRDIQACLSSQHAEKLCQSQEIKTNKMQTQVQPDNQREPLRVLSPLPLGALAAPVLYLADALF